MSLRIYFCSSRNSIIKPSQTWSPLEFNKNGRCFTKKKGNIISFTVYKDRFSAPFTLTFFMSLFSPFGMQIFVYNIEHLLIINFDIKIFNSFINNIYNGVVFFFSSPELKACELFVYPYILFMFSSSSHKVLNKTWVKKIQVCQNKGLRPFPREDNSNIYHQPNFN